jgi:hypothetical protein
VRDARPFDRPVPDKDVGRIANEHPCSLKWAGSIRSSLGRRIGSRPRRFQDKPGAARLPRRGIRARGRAQLSQPSVAPPDSRTEVLTLTANSGEAPRSDRFRRTAARAPITWVTLPRRRSDRPADRMSHNAPEPQLIHRCRGADTGGMHPVRLICPNARCRHPQTVPADMREKLATCRACKTVFRVPATKSPQMRPTPPAG